ncbi:hypothetical protein J2T17_000380 [Paenibacillus mucilaginosus]|uniref:S-layer homology domain-containing protein n=1 Tax=Paenibacillus mucilaginosus TaxID=61624 RepID=UPI003D1D8D4D
MKKTMSSFLILLMLLLYVIPAVQGADYGVSASVNGSTVELSGSGAGGTGQVTLVILRESDGARVHIDQTAADGNGAYAFRTVLDGGDYQAVVSTGEEIFLSPVFQVQAGGSGGDGGNDGGGDGGDSGSGDSDNDNDSDSNSDSGGVTAAPSAPAAPAAPQKPAEPQAPAKPGEPAAAAPAFGDLEPVASWAGPAIRSLGAKGIVNGVSEGSFAPLKEVTRAEYLAMLLRAYGKVDLEAQASFSDVSPRDWHYSVVASAVAQGLVEGVGDNRFEPDRSITREEMSLMTARLLTAIGGKKAVQAEEILRVFKDRESIAPYAAEAVALLVQEGIVNGMTEDTFEPKGMANRAQAAMILARLLGLAS